MKNIISIITMIILSCNSNRSGEVTNAKESSSKSNEKTKNLKEIIAHDSITEPLQTCYWKILQRDTLVAVLYVLEDSVYGKLTFDNYQKDGSSGLVTGTSDGTILKLWYSFQSEGMSSVSEVWLRKEEDHLLLGTGEIAVKGDTAYFSNPASVEFDSGRKLQRVDCTIVPVKYRQLH